MFNRKGHIFLFRGFAPLIAEGHKLRLYLVGNGDHRPVLEKQAKELGLSHVIEYLGFRDDVLEIIGAADLIVHPSLEDALSQSLIESLMLGRPIIATDISGASDTLGDGKYGLLVPPESSEALETAIRETIGNIEAARSKASLGKAHLLRYMNIEHDRRRKSIPTYTKGLPLIGYRLICSDGDELRII